MDTKNSDTQSFWSRIRRKFLVDVKDPETFDTISSFRFSRFRLYFVLFTVFLFGILLSGLIVWYTPAKKWVPGYADPLQNDAYVALLDQVTSLEKSLKEQETYTSSFKKILTKDVERDSSQVNIDPSDHNHSPGIEIPENVPETDEILKDLAIEQTLSELRTNIKVSEKIIGLDKIDQLYFIPPVEGVVSEGFQPDEKHYGVDLLAPKNSPIKSVLDGIVISADWTLETGNTIVVQHGYHVISIYKHNSVILKKVGQSVKAGEAIAIIGNTGTLSDGPHLHFELWINGQAIDPENYVRFD